MKYWLITGIKTNRFRKQLVDNINRLSSFSENIEVVIVETGEAVGSFENSLRQDKEGVVPFLSTAFSYVKGKASPEDWFVRIDADDYYGSKYLKEIDKIRRLGADATGIPSVYLKSENNKLYYCESKRKYFRGACGGTLAGSIEKAIDFKDTGNPWGEDSIWVEEMVDSNYVVLPRSSEDYAFIRWQDHDHTYPIPGDSLPHIWNCNAYDQGDWSPNKLKKDFDKSKPLELNYELAYKGIKKMNKILSII